MRAWIFARLSFAVLAITSIAMVILKGPQASDMVSLVAVCWVISRILGEAMVAAASLISSQEEIKDE